MLNLFGNHIVSFLMTRLLHQPSHTYISFYPNVIFSISTAVLVEILARGDGNVEQKYSEVTAEVNKTFNQGN